MQTARRTPYWSEALDLETKIAMRYMALRPWFEDHKVMDYGATTAIGAKYISFIAETTTLLTTSEFIEPTSHEGRFGWVPTPTLPDSFDADVVLVMEALDDSNNPKEMLAQLANFDGFLAIGCSSSSAWSEDEFAQAIEGAFPTRNVRYLYQEPDFPYKLKQDRHPGSIFSLALIGESAPFSWPSLGIAMPTVDATNEAKEALFSLIRTYPGELEIAVIANGSSPDSLAALRGIVSSFPGQEASLIESETNLGFGQGCNRGLNELASRRNFDYFGVINDDVIPDLDCLGELVWGMKGLESLGLNPGLIGPVSNYVNGPQQVSFGTPNDYAELVAQTSNYRYANACSVTQVRQLRGLFLLIQAQLLEEIGGFDPVFGLGNFEDDDYNLRAHLAGYTLWIAEGSFLYHHGSSTFRKLKIDYTANIARNSEALAAKWQIPSSDQWIHVEAVPTGTSIRVPLDSWLRRDLPRTVNINGEAVDLIHQASDLEFAAWVMNKLHRQPRSHRKAIIDLLEAAA